MHSFVLLRNFNVKTSYLQSLSLQSLMVRCCVSLPYHTHTPTRKFCFSQINYLFNDINFDFSLSRLLTAFLCTLSHCCPLVALWKEEGMKVHPSPLRTIGAPHLLSHIHMLSVHFLSVSHVSLLPYSLTLSATNMCRIAWRAQRLV